VLQITVLSAYAAGGLPQTAPEGRVPLDSLPSPAGGTGDAGEAAKIGFDICLFIAYN